MRSSAGARADLVRASARRLLGFLALAAPGLDCRGAVEQATELADAWQRELGEATASALRARETAIEIARSFDAGVDPLCRAPLPPGQVTVSTSLLHVRKSPGQYARVIRESRTWSRDAAGSVRTLVRVDSDLPDGRHFSRTLESLRIGESRFRALDGRFVEAERIPDFDRELDRAAFAAVDSLFGDVGWDGALLIPAPERGLCAETGERSGLRPPDEARLLHEGRDRVGWVTWADPDGERKLTVSFREVVRPVAEPISAPDSLWPVDPDRSWEELQRFLAAGRAEGWLEEGSGE